MCYDPKKFPEAKVKSFVGRFFIFGLQNIFGGKNPLPEILEDNLSENAAYARNISVLRCKWKGSGNISTLHQNSSLGAYFRIDITESDVWKQFFNIDQQ